MMNTMDPQVVVIKSIIEETTFSMKWRGFYGDYVHYENRLQGQLTREQFERSMKQIDEAIKDYYKSKPHTPRLLRWACMIITCGVTFLWHADEPARWGPSVVAAIEKINAQLRSEGVGAKFYFEAGSKHHFSLQVQLARDFGTEKKAEQKSGGMLTRLAEKMVIAQSSENTTLVHPDTGHDVCANCHTPRGVQNGLPAAACTKCGRSF